MVPAGSRISRCLWQNLSVDQFLHTGLHYINSEVPRSLEKLSVVVNGVNLVINTACHRGKTSCIKL